MRTTHLLATILILALRTTVAQSKQVAARVSTEEGDSAVGVIVAVCEDFRNQARPSEQWERFYAIPSLHPGSCSIRALSYGDKFIVGRAYSCS